DHYKIAVVGSGPAGLSAAAHAAELGVSHVLLEAAPHVSNTIFRYQKGKHVMAEPGVLPLRSPLPFAAGRREEVLGAWNDGVAQHQVNVRHRAEVIAITGGQGAFVLTLGDKSQVSAQFVVLAVGLQGNIRKLGVPGEDLPFVQYQLDDPDEYAGERIIVVGVGDAGLENALALAERNQVTILNQRDDFDRAKEGNRTAILKAIADGTVQCLYNTRVAEVQARAGKPRGAMLVNTAAGKSELPCDRVIARLGAMPPRKFVESAGITFPSADPNAVPAVSSTYESNVPGLYIIGALAGFPLIKQAMNQGYEVVEFIEGRAVEPADAGLLREKFAAVPQWGSVDEAIARIRQRVPVLAPLTPLQLREFLLDSTLHAPAPGTVIFERNDYSNSFYSVIDGSVEVDTSGESGRRISIGAGEFFGEIGLISGRRRTATVRAGADCVLLETPRRSMSKLIASVAAVKRVVDEAFLRRAIQARIAPGVSTQDLAQVLASARVCQFNAGDVLFREGEAGDALHLIRKGSVTVSRMLGGREVVLAYVPAGQYVGEMALVSSQPRSATARAAVATETIRVEGEAFKALMQRHPQIEELIAQLYRERLAQNVAMQETPQFGGVINFLMAQGFGEATDVLLIDESLCIRCDNCEKACADTHHGLSRLNREAGPTFDQLHVPTSCRHCEHPHCMKDCPPDAIKRDENGEVYITDACIGCGNCQRNCPYGVIQMGVEADARPSLWRYFMFGGAEPGRATAHKKGKSDKQKKAAKCDMCRDLPQGPSCVRACPTGAAIRVGPEEFINVLKAQTVE
ncbi:MAG TPA: cyclic nucleotide-binding domain-containing protein, partial [Nevskiaceae bacterium]|nr:cyclic nucleotide-binding domain-containing protein [Nevskiaceae bacterium]